VATAATGPHFTPSGHKKGRVTDPASHITRNVPWSLLQRGWRVQLAELEVQTEAADDSGIVE
jgi:hypothetical protein